jgi:hypothetical protein
MQLLLDSWIKVPCTRFLILVQIRWRGTYLFDKDDRSAVLELKIKHKHGGFNINYEKATVVWQQFGFGS